MAKSSKVVIASICTGAIILGTSIYQNVGSKLICNYYSILEDNILDKNTYDSLIVDEPFELKNINGYVPQGMTFIDGYVLTSSYDYYKDNSSKIDVFDSTGKLLNTCYLENDAHVGGISYDRNNNYLWVTSLGGTVSIYQVKDIFEKSDAIPLHRDLYVGEGLTNYQFKLLSSASFLTINGDKLYVGNFSLEGAGKIKVYTICVDHNKVTLKYERKFLIPDKVQGVTFYTKDNQNYILFSRSYGRFLSSVIQIYKYDEKIDDYNDFDLKYTVLKAPAMIEQITINKDILYSIYESSSLPYVTQDTMGMDNIQGLDIDSLIKKLK